MHHNFRSTGNARGGYILLVTILVIGVVASAVLSSLLMLGTSAGTLTLSVQQSSQALGAAQGCAEYALRALRASPNYTGNELLTIGVGECDILQIGGIGNNNRTVCVDAQVGDTVRRLEIVVNQLLPQTKIFSWQEVPSFTLCQ